MSTIGLYQTIFRELISIARQNRGRPPSEALSLDRRINALEGTGNANGKFAAGYLYHTAHISLTLGAAKRCVDIGAAPGCQLLQLAALHPKTEFVGVDNNVELIEVGIKNTAELGLGNVRWIKDDITTLGSCRDNVFDAAISTMTLHDLKSIQDVHACLAATSRVLVDDGAVYIEDYARLKSAKSVDYFNAPDNTALGQDFQELNRASMTAAFTLEELRDAFSTLLPQATVYSTFLIPFLTVAKTPNRTLAPSVAEKLTTLRETLTAEKRKDLDDLCKFFRLGGWVGDPFCADN